MGIIVPEIELPIHGHFKLSLFDSETGEFIDSREADNLLVTSGLNILTQALNWLFIQNQNAGWGSPFTALTNLGNMWGAVGTSTTAPNQNQTGLLTEIGRALVTNAAFSGSQMIYDFFLGTTIANGAISEVGAFLQANLIQTTLTTSLANGSNYTSLAVSATTADIPINSTIVIGYGSGQTQTAITSSDTPSSSTTINIVQITANANYSGGTAVAYTPGTMLDRTTFAAITKTSSMTGILEITLSLISG